MIAHPINCIWTKHAMMNADKNLEKRIPFALFYIIELYWLLHIDVTNLLLFFTHSESK